MSKYINDPREMEIRPESGITLEEANRVETMYHWGAMVLDLCDMPVEEYMKPMTVITEGSSSGGDDSKKTTVNIHGSLVPPAEEGAPWKLKLQWTGDFPTVIAVGAKVKDQNSSKTTFSTDLADNADKMIEIEIPGTENAESLEITSLGVAKEGTAASQITKSTYTETHQDDGQKYEFNISADESTLELTLRYIIDNMTVQSVTGLKFGDAIPEFTGTTEKEGFIFDGWFDANGQSYDTMPAKDLNLYATYSKPTNMYYGLLQVKDIYALTDDDDKLADMSVISSTAEFGVMTMTMEQNAEYEEKYYENQDEELSDEDFAAYLNSIGKDIVIVCPEDVDLTRYAFTWVDGGLEKVTFDKVKQINVSGIPYVVWFNDHKETINGLPVSGYHPSVGKDTDLSIRF